MNPPCSPCFTIPARWEATGRVTAGRVVCYLIKILSISLIYYLFTILLRRDGFGIRQRLVDFSISSGRLLHNEYPLVRMYELPWLRLPKRKNNCSPKAWWWSLMIFSGSNVRFWTKHRGWIIHSNNLRSKKERVFTTPDYHSINCGAWCSGIVRRHHGTRSKSHRLRWTVLKIYLKMGDGSDWSHRRNGNKQIDT